ncbi:hypothetical protein QR98_0066840 [Sarcoptes scabiei]|uniref:Ig-like domain-containing protein n=1 Tax=Sarcoptes scabiei TaxID=52283 RepID=A0A132ACJ7_SARSC|nr:hypothetical protein QR98_0066840 [Sarcoptes scabiei]
MWENHLRTLHYHNSFIFNFIIISSSIFLPIPRPQKKIVVQQAFKLQVYDEFVIKENTAIMRCHVSTIVRDYIKIVSWIRDEQTLVTASSNLAPK